MDAGPGIYNYKHQVNAYETTSRVPPNYGETSVYKRDCGQLVPNTAVVNKTDWREGSAHRVDKPKKQLIASSGNDCGLCSRPPSKRTRKWWASPTRNCPRRGSCHNPMIAPGCSNDPSLEESRSIQLSSQTPRPPRVTARPRLPQRASKTSWSHVSSKCACSGSREREPGICHHRCQVFSTHATCRPVLRGGKCLNTSPPRKCSDGSSMESRWSSQRVFPLRRNLRRRNSSIRKMWNLPSRIFSRADVSGCIKTLLREATSSSPDQGFTLLRTRPSSASSMSSAASTTHRPSVRQPTRIFTWSSRSSDPKIGC
jgi:hypothetical protein